MKLYRSRILSFLCFALGLALFVRLLLQVGMQPSLARLQALGLASLALIAITGLAHALKVRAWSLAFLPENQPISGWRLWWVRMAGESLNYLSAIGPVLGDPVKVILIRHHASGSTGASSVVMDRAVYVFSTLLFVVAGLFILLVSFGAGIWLKILLPLLVGILCLALAVIWALPQRVRLLSKSFRKCQRIKDRILLKKPAERAEEFSLGRQPQVLGAGTGEPRRGERKSSVAPPGLRSIAPLTQGSRPGLNSFARSAGFFTRIEDQIFEFHQRKPHHFSRMLALNLAAHGLIVLEIWLILWAMGSPIGWLDCLMLAASTKAINLAFFFVPGQIGVFEGGNVLVAGLLGLPPDIGVALGLARRLFDLFWAAIGLFVLFGFALFPQSRDRQQAGRDPLADARGAEIEPAPPPLQIQELQ